MEGPCDRLEEVCSALGKNTIFNLCNDTDNYSDTDSQIASEHVHVDIDTQHTDSDCVIVDANTHTDSDCVLVDDAITHTEFEQKPSSDEGSDLDRTPSINFVPDLDRTSIIHFVPTATV